ncbi:MAG: phosphatidate cytidylyltransferase [Methylococcaceae bacterium]
MLIQRIITALVLVPLVILAIFKLSPEWFALIYGIIILMAAWEWTNLIAMRSIIHRGLFLCSMLAAMLFFHYWWMVLEQFAQMTNVAEIRNYSWLVEATVGFPVIWWVLMMILIRRNPLELISLQLRMRYKALIGWFVLIAGWLFLSRLRLIESPEMTLYFLILIWSADIAAYFVGKKYGTTKLAPDISPGKTLAGYYGALGAAVLCGIGFGIYFHAIFISFADMLMLSMITVIVSIYGDLFFSLVKRQGGMKDSGGLLPGHGGLLDRLDSVIAAAPFFYAGVWVIRWMMTAAIVE